MPEPWNTGLSCLLPKTATEGGFLGLSFGKLLARLVQSSSSLSAASPSPLAASTDDAQAQGTWLSSLLGDVLLHLHCTMLIYFRKLNLGPEKRGHSLGQQYGLSWGQGLDGCQHPDKDYVHSP